MAKIMAVAVGALIGGTSRALINGWLAGPHHFMSTLIVNLVGAFLLSFITTGLPAKLPVSPTLMTGLSTGLIGSFTTFSTFSVETLQLIQSGHSVLAGGYLALSLGGASLAAWLAISCNNRWLQHPKGGAD